ncbi:hypothetical protein SMSP2_00762 [Limihaloglobus sulfuriphilus]|uniref:Uncharacterized protein n=1 Tax=Limihaloglobus sulfuriphilus TaxID=1851148 RepID=A0A1Q2MCM2_9BACT|nr:hypothetical protein SMSP2_00762 [Limihaloglobus sulfuriphilus]
MHNIKPQIRKMINSIVILANQLYAGLDIGSDEQDYAFRSWSTLIDSKSDIAAKTFPQKYLTELLIT